MEKENPNLLNKLLVHELRQLHSTESQLMEALPHIAGVASAYETKNLLAAHIAKIASHKNRLQQIGSALHMNVEGEHCKIVDAQIGEIKELIPDNTTNFQTDIALVLAVLRLQKYEIARYKTALYLAMHLKYTNVALNLHISLNEEKKADALLTKFIIDNIDKNTDLKKEEQFINT